MLYAYMTSLKSPLYIHWSHVLLLELFIFWQQKIIPGGSEIKTELFHFLNIEIKCVWCIWGKVLTYES